MQIRESLSLIGNTIFTGFTHGYQITQHRKPILTGGRINDGVRVERVQLEMDTGKTSTSTVSSDDGGTIHEENSYKCCLSRAGSTLLK